MTEQSGEASASPAETVFQRAVVIGANGAVGRLFARLLSEGAREVVAVDRGDLPHADLDHTLYCSCDGRHPDRKLQETLRSAQVVILAIPEPEALEAIPALAPLISTGSLIVDTTSVKSRICPRAAKLTESIQYLSINPMFAPSAGFAGQNVAVVTVKPGGHAQAFRNLMEHWGALTTEVDAEEHDRITAAVQVATHAAILAFAAALRQSGYDPDVAAQLATPPHRSLLALVERVAAGSPEVYWDIQKSNPNAAGVRQALANGLDELSDFVERNDFDSFRELWTHLRRLLADPKQ